MCNKWETSHINLPGVNHGDQFYPKHSIPAYDRCAFLDRQSGKWAMSQVSHTKRNCNFKACVQGSFKKPGTFASETPDFEGKSSPLDFLWGGENDTYEVSYKCFEGLGNNPQYEEEEEEEETEEVEEGTFSENKSICSQEGSSPSSPSSSLTSEDIGNFSPLRTFSDSPIQKTTSEKHPNFGNKEIQEWMAENDTSEYRSLTPLENGAGEPLAFCTLPQYYPRLLKHVTITHCRTIVDIGPLRGIETVEILDCPR